ncbi:hypothetical protein M0R88_16060 [Halorussus gelatinilyticus]|uniref:Uncharacterized protein n=1 Tax=Halorussus gelatinilyticus TaxID=2937524 RepID=A0A8U0IH45_9EURY|nr:hypothetical protein [Halorussus gelatinilyticus]UPW00016.1 hypothetical protein M0R88_16060 [Halorussus gelatinilyticus]
MSDENKSTRRRLLRTVGIATAGLAATVPASAEKVATSDGPTVSPDFYDGQRVTDGNDDGYVSIYNQPDTDTFDQTYDGGVNPPYGNALGSAVEDPDSGVDFVEVDWDGGPTGWSPTNGVPPVNTY